MGLNVGNPVYTINYFLITKTATEVNKISLISFAPWNNNCNSLFYHNFGEYPYLLRFKFQDLEPNSLKI